MGFDKGEESGKKREKRIDDLEVLPEITRGGEAH